MLSIYNNRLGLTFINLTLPFKTVLQMYVEPNKRDIINVSSSIKMIHATFLIEDETFLLKERNFVLLFFILESLLTFLTCSYQIYTQQIRGRLSSCPIFKVIFTSSATCGFFINSSPNRAPKKIKRETPVIRPIRF